MGLDSMLYTVDDAGEFVEIAYWRKANFAHKWFVDNVQNGIDECQVSLVTTEQLEELCNVCRRVLEDNSLASELLPTASGFFFGTTEYSEWYYAHVQHVLEDVSGVLNSQEYKNKEIFYRASW